MDRIGVAISTTSQYYHWRDRDQVLYSPRIPRDLMSNSVVINVATKCHRTQTLPCTSFKLWLMPWASEYWSNFNMKQWGAASRIDKISTMACWVTSWVCNCQKSNVHSGRKSAWDWYNWKRAVASFDLIWEAIPCKSLTSTNLVATKSISLVVQLNEYLGHRETVNWRLIILPFVANIPGGIWKLNIAPIVPKTSVPWAAVSQRNWKT